MDGFQPYDPLSGVSMSIAPDDANYLANGDEWVVAADVAQSGDFNDLTIAGVHTANSVIFNQDGSNYAERPIETADVGGLDGDLKLAFDALNEAGSIKANMTGVSLTGFAAGVTQTLDINAGTPTIVSSVTVYPLSTVTESFAAIFDPARSTSNPVGIVGKLIENPVLKQRNGWRFGFSFSNKSQSSNPGICVELTNPETGFIDDYLVTLPSGTTAGFFTLEMSTVSDMGSLGVGSGYLLNLCSTITDNNITFNLDDITRFNQATQTIVTYP